MEQNGLLPWDLIDTGIDNPHDAETLCSRWIVPPFSVLDSRQGYWRKRKKLWLKLGIESELGRGEAITWGIDPDGTSTSDPSVAWTDRGKKRIDPSPSGSPRPACDYSKRQRGDGRGRPMARTFGQDLMRGENAKFAQGQGKINHIFGRPEDAGGVESKSGTSIFDPVLCELAYQWFCPPGGRVLDPFAGGSVRGIVASKTGRQYIGIDLSERQILANREQGAAIVPDNPPTWLHGDSGGVRSLTHGQFDLIFSCPPYHDLEIYSDDPADLSTMSWEAFLDKYCTIIRNCASMLKDHRFACFVVSQIRDKKGCINDLVGWTVQAFADAGLDFYNDVVFLNALGSLPIRTNKQFSASRKIGRCHQNILLFLKGDPKKAVAEIGNDWPVNGWPYQGLTAP